MDENPMVEFGNIENSVPEWFQPIHRAGVSKHYRNLPHWKMLGGTYFVTFRQADSLSRAMRIHWNQIRKAWLGCHPKPWDKKTVKEYNRQFSTRLEQMLDAGYGSCILREINARSVLRDTLLYFEGERYYLDSFVIMPNHVHVLLSPITPFHLSTILHSWKSYSSQIICRKFSYQAPFWLNESWDHLVRSKYYFLKYRCYILDNPRKAGLSDSEYTIWQRE